MRLLLAPGSAGRFAALRSKRAARAALSRPLPVVVPVAATVKLSSTLLERSRSVTESVPLVERASSVSSRVSLSLSPASASTVMTGSSLVPLTVMVTVRAIEPP